MTKRGLQTLITSYKEIVLDSTPLSKIQFVKSRYISQQIKKIQSARPISLHHHETSVTIMM